MLNTNKMIAVLVSGASLFMGGSPAFADTKSNLESWLQRCLLLIDARRPEFFTEQGRERLRALQNPKDFFSEVGLTGVKLEPRDRWLYEGDETDDRQFNFSAPEKLRLHHTINSGPGERDEKILHELIGLSITGGWPSDPGQYGKLGFTAKLASHFNETLHRYPIIELTEVVGLKYQESHSATVGDGATFISRTQIEKYTYSFSIRGEKKEYRRLHNLVYESSLAGLDPAAGRHQLLSGQSLFNFFTHGAPPATNPLLASAEKFDLELSADSSFLGSHLLGILNTGPVDIRFSADANRSGPVGKIELDLSDIKSMLGLSSPQIEALLFKHLNFSGRIEASILRQYWLSWTQREDNSLDSLEVPIEGLKIIFGKTPCQLIIEGSMAYNPIGTPSLIKLRLDAYLTGYDQLIEPIDGNAPDELLPTVKYLASLANRKGAELHWQVRSDEHGNVSLNGKRVDMQTVFNPPQE